MGKKVADEVRPQERRVNGVARLVVCVSSNSETQQHIIRKAARVADMYNAEWIALYVQTSDEQTDRIPLDAQRHLMSHLELVMQLGGQVQQVVSDNVAQVIADVCLDICRVGRSGIVASVLFHQDYHLPCRQPSRICLYSCCRCPRRCHVVCWRQTDKGEG